MNYRTDKYGKELSLLGFGCMRFTRKGAGIDIAKAEKEIMEAYSSGVNYYDTAYMYTGSEAALGEIFERNGIRDKVMIATKLPQYLVQSSAAIDRFFDEELKRLRTDYVDYYLMHLLTDFAMWEKLKKFGIIEWIEKKKKSGEVRNIGFSYHGHTDGFLQILNDYDWDFCQIQYNYMDDVSQAGVRGLKAAAEKGIPVIIMEPLRGGKLINVPKSAREIMEKSGRGWSPAEWGFRWLYDQPEVTVVLSGMNSLEMVRENVRIASEAKPHELTQEDFDIIDQVKEKIRQSEKVGCTGCRYCMPCPQGVNIPGIFKSYNSMFIDSRSQGRFEYIQNYALTRESSFATNCIGCGKCEKHCPQNIPIREKLKEADRALRPLPYKIAIAVARKFMFRNSK